MASVRRPGTISSLRKWSPASGVLPPALIFPRSLGWVPKGSRAFGHGRGALTPRRMRGVVVSVVVTPWGLGCRRLRRGRTGHDPQCYALTTACAQCTCLASHRDIRPQTYCQYETAKSVRMAIVTWQSAFGRRATPIPMVWYRV